MSDELDDLKDLFDAELPAPDPAHKAAAVALAMKNFDRLQETDEQARQTSEPKRKGFFGGLKMLFEMNTRAVLTATTALAAVALIAVIPVVTKIPDAPGGGGGLMTTVSEGDDLATVDAEPLREEVADEAPSVAPPVVMFEATPGEAAAGRAAPKGAANTPARSTVARPAPRPMVAPRMSASPSAGGGQPFSDVFRSGQTLSMPPAPSPTPTIDRLPPTQLDTEAFPEAESNPIKVTAESPVSTFSIDVDTASWSMVRNSLMRGQLPPEGAVRIEEMVNYFTYDYPAPEGDAPFATHVGVQDSPWRDGTQIVQIGLQGMLPDARPPMNLVFLIDTSGSMNQPNKLPLLKQSFRLMLGQLSEEDSVSIVTYAGSAGRVLDPIKATETDKILNALDTLSAGGSTAGQAGLQQAYATAKEMAREGAVSRVILATDGDFNVGLSDPDALKDYIAKERESGTYLSVLGFGRGNLDDATMQALAQTGNGMASYIDTLSEAQKVLVDQLTGALVPIADDVKIQVEWNPALVAEYRLIGYETRALKREDFNNDKVDAGEIGAGHQVTALYEITPVGSGARMTDPLRYGADTVTAEEGASGELGFLKLRYKAPGAEDSQLIETPILADAAPLAGGDWALAIAGFGQLLKGSDLIGDWSMGDALALAQSARGEDLFGYRQEAINLLRLADSLSR